MRAAVLCLAFASFASVASGCGTYRLSAGDGGVPVPAPDDAAVLGDDAGGALPDAPPLGATPHPGGVYFRVWAAHAASVAVVGDFNAWDATATPLAGEGASHIFGGDVAGAVVGQEYAYAVTLADGSSV